MGQISHENIPICRGAGASTIGFVVKLGGRYQLAITANWGGGNVTFNRITGDGTALSLDDAFTANGGGTYDLPPGAYQVVIVTATAVNADLNRVPGD